MFPSDSKTATLSNVARLWAHERQQPEADVRTVLLQAIWSRDLRLWNPNGDLSLRQLVTLLYRTQPHGGIAIVSDSSDIPPAQEPTDDGGMIVRLSRFVVLAGDPASWDDAVVAAATAVLREAEEGDFSENFLAAVLPLDLDRDEIADWCAAKSHPRPRFWFGDSEEKQIGYGGRPSFMAEIKLELRRRAEAGVMDPMLREESESLALWAEDHAPGTAPQAKSIENAIRDLYKQLKARQAKKHKT
jgi:hypothetical protein